MQFKQHLPLSCLYVEIYYHMQTTKQNIIWKDSLQKKSLTCEMVCFQAIKV